MRSVSGIRASGNPHLGNYLGAMKPQIELQQEFDELFYFIADLHAITTPIPKDQLRASSLQIAALYLALGLDPEKAVLFAQNQIPEHAELCWILLTVARMGELERMTQFKEKGRGASREGVGAGLLAYPVLQAADVLLYQADVVPIGADQVQHLELTRDLATRFNSQYGQTFKLPEIQVRKETARILGLDDPAKKMSKSAASEYNYIALTDDPDTVERKIKKAVTDSGSSVKLADDKPALKNLLTIFAGVTDRDPAEIAADFQGKGYAEFKTALAEAIIAFLGPVQAKYRDLMADESHLIDLLHTGARRARPIAQATLRDVKERLGFVL